jgi:RNA polymerase sigma-70 factor (ECF subfamily)
MKPGPAPTAPRIAEFDALYQRFQKEVWALVYARWLNSDLALDIVQEAFLRLWKQWQQGEVILHPRAWLLRVARNLAEDYAKSSFHRNGTQPPQTMNGVSGKEDSPLTRLEEQETFAQVRKGLAELPPGDREILTLRYALDYNPSRIAQIMETTVPAIHMRLTRARQRLVERLSAQGVGQSS